jgi:Spy/CpxP family protein refolding chaperone
MKKIITGLLALALIVVIAAGVSMAYGGSGGIGMKRLYIENRQYINNPLELSEEEIDKFGEFKEEFFEKRNELTNELRDKNRELSNLILANASDEEISNLRNEINVLQNNLMNIRTDQLNGIKGMLSDEQLEELLDMDRSANQKSFKRGGKRGKR